MAPRATKAMAAAIPLQCYRGANTANIRNRQVLGKEESLCPGFVWIEQVEKTFL